MQLKEVESFWSVYLITYHFLRFPFFRYLDNKVFVSLANGEVIVYQREAGELTSKNISIISHLIVNLVFKNASFIFN